MTILLVFGYTIKQISPLKTVKNFVTKEKIQQELKDLHDNSSNEFTTQDYINELQEILPSERV